MSASYTKSHVLLQGFNWNSWRENNKTHYRYLQTKSKTIKEVGVDGVWFPPPVKSVSPQGYMPLDLYDLNSQYGSAEDLRRCIETFHNDEIDVYADIVLNHRCAEFQNEEGIYNVFGGRMAWNNTAIVGNDSRFKGAGNPKYRPFFDGAPNIDHSQDFVREDIVNWLLWLKNDVRFDGFRFDFALGYDGRYVREYVERTNMKLVVGEYWDAMEYLADGILLYDQDYHRQQIVNWMDSIQGRASAFDMTTKGILQQALRNGEYWRLADGSGKPSGLIGWWSENSVTFLDNHDTHCDSQNHWPFPNDKVIEGYCYLLTHPGVPMIYWDHFNDPELKGLLIHLIRLRKEHNICSASRVNIIEASNRRYLARIDDQFTICIGEREAGGRELLGAPNVSIYL